MGTRPKISEAKTLEQYRVTFENTESQPQIASTMAEYGYDPAGAKKEAEALYETTRQAFDSNQTETDEATAAYAFSETKKDQLYNIYSSHRKKAGVVFRDDSLTADKLKLSGTHASVHTSNGWRQSASSTKIAIAGHRHTDQTGTIENNNR